METAASAIARKLLIKPGSRWLMYNAPAEYQNILESLPLGATISFSADGSFDGIILFTLNSEALAGSLAVINALLKIDTVFWIAYPKKTSVMKSDLEMMGNWDEPAKYGLRIVATAAIDKVWTALRFKQEDTVKLSATRNDKIEGSDYAEYIDVANKQVTLPPEVKVALEQSAVALNFYQQLSYSNKKEYVVWILTAKQEKTRLDRLEKMIEKLASGKKNPSEK